MSNPQIIWLLLIVSATIINLPLIGYIRYLIIAGKIEMVLTEFQGLLDKLNALVAPVTALKATADGAATAIQPQDLQDTLAALDAAVNAISAAAGQVST